MKKFLLPVSLLFLFILSGCSSVHVISVQSLEKEKEIYKGREISYKIDDNYVTELEVDGINNGKIYFYIYIKNKTDKAIEIRPEGMYLKSYSSERDLDEGNGVKYWAFDPENALEEIKDDMDKAKNWKDAAVGLNCCFSFFSFVSHITSDDDYEIIEAVDDAAGFAVRHAVIESEYKGEMRQLHSEKEFWRNEVLRRTNLLPGEEIGGIVVMPLPEKVKFLRVVIPFEKNDHTYLYELRKMKRR